MVEHYKGFTPLMWASSEGHERVVEVLISFGACTDYSHPLTGQTAVQLATERGHLGVVQRLRRHLVLPHGMEMPVPPFQQTQQVVVPSDLPGMLVSLGLDKYIPVLQSKGVDSLETFLGMTDQELRQAGVGLLGPRKKMLAAIGQYKAMAVTCTDNTHIV